MSRPTLTPEQQAEAQRIYQLRRRATDDDLRDMAELLAGKETVLQIALGSGISKQSVYKYRDLWLDYYIVLLNGPQLRPHPDLFELTVTEA